MNKQSRMILTYIFLLFFSFSCSTTRPIVNYTDNPIPGGIKLDKIADAIKKAGLDRGWIIVDSQEKTVLRGVLEVRTHRVEVSIPYSTSSYSIIYHDSRNMKYDASSKTIHRKFMKWSANLKAEIDQQLALLGLNK